MLSEQNIMHKFTLDKARKQKVDSKMRAVLQRVSRASVSVGGEVSGAIGPGLMVLLGVQVGDTREEMEWLAGKIAQMRVFSDSEGLMNLSVQDIGGEVLVVSQFTLMAKTRKGNRPSYIEAARPDEAVPLYEAFVRQMAELTGRAVPTGVFGADMKIDMLADGPVTIVMDTRQRDF